MNETKLEYAEYANGRFAICPRCRKTMAHNVCGYWDCIFGCGLRVADESRQEIERRKEESGMKLLDQAFFKYARDQLLNATPEEIAHWYVTGMILKGSNGDYLMYLIKEYRLPSDVLKMHKKICRLADEAERKEAVAWTTET